MAKETRLYDLLGVAPDATEAEIKKAYRLMALKWHPDKNGHSKESTERFQEVTRAYEALYDSSKRAIYDRYGEAGLNHGGIPTESPADSPAAAFSMKADDLFSQFFGDSFFTQSSSMKERVGPTIRHKLSCTLEELYKGKSTKLGLSKSVLCSQCDAKGGVNLKTCAQCRGRGRVVMQKQTGPIIQRFETTCKKCNGSGEYMSAQDRCTKCQGRRTVDERKILQLQVKPGSKGGQSIIFKGEGDQGVDIIPGDVVVTIEERPHKRFKRKGDDLFITVRIDLLTALAGGAFPVHHLSGEWLKVIIIPGEIISPNSLKSVEGYGMPKKGTSSFGNLYVHFEVEFPTASQLSEESFKALESALPPRPTLNIPNGVEQSEKVLSEVDPYHFEEKNDRKKRRVDVEISDEDEVDSPQCRTQ